MYKVYGLPLTRCFRVLWTLEEIGTPYELIEVAPHSDAVTERNLSGKVPVLEIDGQYITDSTAIMTYLADRHGALTFPAGTIERARQDALTNLVLDELDAVIWTAARHSFILPEEKRVPQVKDSLKWEYERNVARLSQLMGGPFLMGEQMTIADIICVHCLNWAHVAGFPAPDQTLLEYGKRLRARPAFRAVAAMVKRGD